MSINENEEPLAGGCRGCCSFGLWLTLFMIACYLLGTGAHTVYVFISK